MVNMLAFRSNIGEDPNHVPRLCMHEKPGTDESDEIIAIHQARHGQCVSTLKVIKDGFESIFFSLYKVLQSEKALISSR